MDELIKLKARLYDLQELNANMNLEVTNFLTKLGKLIDINLEGEKTLNEVLDKIAKFQPLPRVKIEKSKTELNPNEI